MTYFRVITVITIISISSFLYFSTFAKVGNQPTHHANHSPLQKTYMLKQQTSELTSLETLSTERDEVLALWNKFDGEASEWGEKVPGVKNRMATDEKLIALTFDACGGSLGAGYDEVLITFLREEKIPATLFVNARWIDTNEEQFKQLAADPLFSIQNHGTDHLPLSIHGKSAWGIEGTNSVEDVIDEVMENQKLIYQFTNETPAFFRSGTAFYDEIAVEIVQDLGLEAVNYDILGDAGATYSAAQVKQALLQSQEGSIPLLHMNQPNSGTAEGVQQAIPQLKEAGFEFVLLEDYELVE